MSICSRAQYRLYTGDLQSYDGAADTALVNSQSYVEDQTERYLESDTYTETLEVKSNGRVYPRALPLTSVSSPTGATIEGPAILGAGYGWDSVDIDTSNTLTLVPRYLVSRATVTYIGGYGEGEAPIDLVKLIANIAYADMHPQPALAGASSISVGDVTVTGSSGSYSRDIVRGLTRWGRRSP